MVVGGLGARSPGARRCRLLLRPSASRASTSSWRAVSPAGFARVAGSRPRGTLLTPASRSRARNRAATARASSVVEQRERGQQVVGRPGVPQRHRPLVGLVVRDRARWPVAAGPTCWTPASARRRDQRRRGASAASRPAYGPGEQPGHQRIVEPGVRAPGDPGVLGERGRSRPRPCRACRASSPAATARPGAGSPAARPGGPRACRARGAATAGPAGGRRTAARRGRRRRPRPSAPAAAAAAPAPRAGTPCRSGCHAPR